MFFFSDNASPSSEDSGSTQAGVESLSKDENDQTSEPNDVSLLFKSNCAVSTLQQDWDTCKDLCLQYILLLLNSPLVEM